MININVLKTKVFISPLFFAVLTAILLLDKTGISGLAVLFSILHELGHFLALVCVKQYPESIEITVFGIHISLLENLSTLKKCLVLKAGFVTNFILAALFFIIKKTLFGYINLIIGIFTSVPLSSTDGGTVLKILLEKFYPQKAEKLFKIISIIVFVVFSVFLIFAMIFTKNYFILIAIVYMIVCIKRTAV